MARPFSRARDVTTFAEIIRGTPGPDTIEGTADGQTLAGLRGNDRLRSAFTDTTLVGGVGDDRMLSTYSLGSATPAYAATLDGGVGNDRLTVRLDAAGSSPSAYAGSATLLASGGDGNDRINVTANFDSTVISPELAFDFLLLGGAGADTIQLDFRDVVGRREGTIRASGGSGADVIDAFVASDSENDARAAFDGDGGGGNDVLRVTVQAVSNKQDVASVATLVGLGGDDEITLTQVVRGASLGEMTARLTGGSGDDVIRATGVVDDVDFLLVDRQILGGGGNDELRAELPIDSFQSFNSAEVTNRLEGGLGNDLIVATIGVVRASVPGVRANLVFGGDGDDRIVVGGGNANRIEGGAGADTIVLRPLATEAQRTLLVDFDRNADRFEIAGLSDQGAPGLVDDLDAIATFAATGPGVLRVTIGALILDVAGAPTNADSFADLVANPATQIFASDDAFA